MAQTTPKKPTAKRAKGPSARKHTPPAPVDDYLLDVEQVARRLGGCVSPQSVPDYASRWPALVDSYRPLRVTGGRKVQHRWLLSGVVRHLRDELGQGIALARDEAIARWQGAD